MNYRDYLDKTVEGIEFEKGELVLLHFWGENRTWIR